MVGNLIRGFHSAQLHPLTPPRAHPAVQLRSSLLHAVRRPLFSWATSWEGQAAFRDGERHRGGPCGGLPAAAAGQIAVDLAWPSPSCPRGSCTRHSSLVTRHSSLSTVVVVLYIRGERECILYVCVFTALRIYTHRSISRGRRDRHAPLLTADDVKADPTDTTDVAPAASPRTTDGESDAPSWAELAPGFTSTWYEDEDEAEHRSVLTEHELRRLRHEALAVLRPWFLRTYGRSLWRRAEAWLNSASSSCSFVQHVLFRIGVLCVSHGIDLLAAHKPGDFIKLMEADEASRTRHSSAVALPSQARLLDLVSSAPGQHFHLTRFAVTMAMRTAPSYLRHDRGPEAIDAVSGEARNPGPTQAAPLSFFQATVAFTATCRSCTRACTHRDSVWCSRCGFVDHRECVAPGCLGDIRRWICGYCLGSDPSGVPSHRAAAVLAHSLAAGTYHSYDSRVRSFIHISWRAGLRTTPAPVPVMQVLPPKSCVVGETYSTTGVEPCKKVRAPCWDNEVERAAPTITSDRVCVWPPWHGGSFG